jgi:hypothetical protein
MRVCLARHLIPRGGSSENLFASSRRTGGGCGVRSSRRRLEPEPVPAEPASRIAEFIEPRATAISNVHARSGLVPSSASDRGGRGRGAPPSGARSGWRREAAPRSDCPHAEAGPCCVSDDGTGGAVLGGTGLIGIRERLAALERCLRVAGSVGSWHPHRASIRVASSHTSRERGMARRHWGEGNRRNHRPSGYPYM